MEEIIRARGCGSPVKKGAAFGRTVPYHAAFMPFTDGTVIKAC